MSETMAPAGNAAAIGPAVGATRPPPDGLPPGDELAGSTRYMPSRFDPAIAREQVGEAIEHAIRAGAPDLLFGYAVAPLFEAMDRPDLLAAITRIARAFPEPDASSPAPEAMPLRTLTVSEFLRTAEPPAYAIDGLLIAGYCFAITGHSGHGKTAIALPMAVSVALGLPFAGRDVKQARVLYIAGENPDDVALRLLALLRELDLRPEDVDDHLHILDSSFVLDERHAELMKIIETGGFGFVVIDTDQAVSSGSDENDNRQRVEHAKRVRMLTKASSKPTVVDLCHPAGNATRATMRPRGGTSFLAEIDGQLGCWIEEGETRVELFRTTKFRGPMFDPIPFDIRIVEAMVDSKGRGITPAVALPASDADQRDSEARNSERLIALLADVSLHPAASIRNRASTTGLSRSTVERDLKKLAAMNAIAESLMGYDITPKGKKWLAQT